MTFTNNTHKQEYMTKEEQENTLKDFISKITDDVQDVPPEIQEAVDEHFFDLL